MNARWSWTRNTRPFEDLMFLAPEAILEAIEPVVFLADRLLLGAENS
jgi:hypothetical protein